MSRRPTDCNSKPTPEPSVLDAGRRVPASSLTLTAATENKRTRPHARPPAASEPRASPAPREGPAPRPEGRRSRRNSTPRGSCQRRGGRPRCLRRRPIRSTPSTIGSPSQEGASCPSGSLRRHTPTDSRSHCPKRLQWRARQDSNLRPSAPEADALSTELQARGRPSYRSSVGDAAPGCRVHQARVFLGVQDGAGLIPVRLDDSRKVDVARLECGSGGVESPLRRPDGDPE
jgi:hypothetical protein